MVAPTYSWNVIAATQTDADSPGDQALMDAIRENLIHLEEWLGDSYTAAKDHDHDGVNSAIMGPSVGQGQLNVATDAGSIGLSPNDDKSYTLTGGSWSWWTGSADTSEGAVIVFGYSNTAAGVIGLHNHGSVGTFYVDERYIQASPPYDLGDGEIPLFVCILVKGGEILGTKVGPDPVWAHNGPTRITPDIWIAGKPHQRRLILPPELAVRPSGLAVVNYLKDLAHFRANAAEKDYQLVEVTQAVKNADMDIVPHPFGDTMGGTVIYLDPVSDLVYKLSLLHKAGENVRDLILAGYIEFGNTELGRNRPAGTMTVAPRWKNTA